MKKIFVDVYLAFNLGDDLFLDLLAKKFPKTQFTVNYVGDNYDEFLIKYPNVTRRRYSIYDKILQKTRIKDTLTDYKTIAKQHDAMIFIGGSIFREESYHQSLYEDRLNLIEEFNQLEKPVFVLGSNFGPIKTNKFVEDYQHFFEKCYDVCFRDTNSYHLFQHMNNVRCEPDIVFQMEIKNEKKLDNKQQIGFSIIDVNHKDGLGKYKNQYIESTIKTIEYFVNKGYECCLMSFCEREGDLKTIQLILKQLDKSIHSKISVYEYKGDLEEALNVISNFKLFIAARFHANILAQLLEVPILPVIYSPKTANMLHDIGFKNTMIQMNQLEKMYDESVINSSFSNVLDISLIRKNSQNQFTKLKSFIEE